MKDLELENQRLRKAVADLTLDKLILAEAAGVRRHGKLTPRIAATENVTERAGAVRT